MPSFRLLLPLPLVFALVCPQGNGLLWSQIGQPRLVPDSTSARQLEYERILGQPHPSFAQGEIRCDELIKQLNEMGVPVSLDQSAMDDSLAYDTPVELPPREWPLWDRLVEGLKRQNATFALRGDRLLIASMDSVSDLEYFHQVTYDISVLPIRFDSEVDVEPIIRVVRMTVHPDDWDDTNGDQSIVPIFSGGHALLVVSASLDTHLEIRRLFNSIVGLSGVSPLNLANRLDGRRSINLSRAASAQFGHQFGGSTTDLVSTAIQLPQAPRRAGIAIPNQKESSQSGFGGGGVSGGVFTKVP